MEIHGNVYLDVYIYFRCLLWSTIDVRYWMAMLLMSISVFNMVLSWNYKVDGLKSTCLLQPSPNYIFSIYNYWEVVLRFNVINKVLVGNKMYNLKTIYPST